MRNVLYIIIALLAFGCDVCHAQKLSPNTSIMLNSMVDNKTEGMENTTVSVFITVKNAAVIDKIKEAGAVVNCNLSDNIITATIPLSAINTVAALDDVESVSVGTDVHLLMDAARKQTGVDDCHTMTDCTGPFTGKGGLSVL